jgi:hypothetical protein
MFVGQNDKNTPGSCFCLWTVRTVEEWRSGGEERRGEERRGEESRKPGYDLK